jgi:hypothetical protein
VRVFRVPPELADPVGAVEVRESEESEVMEKLGSGSRPSPNRELESFVLT